MKVKYLAVIVLLAGMSLAAVSRADYWKDGLSEEQVALFNKLLEPTVKLYHEGRQDEALLALDPAFKRAEDMGMGRPFYTRVWCEAQLETGKHDPDWAARIYIYLYEREVQEAPGHAQRIPPNNYVLYGNISDCLYDCGKAAEARSWILKMEDSICDDQHLNTKTPEVYADRGPLFSYMSAVRMRDFPLYDHQRRDTELNGGTPRFIYYPLMYGVRDIAEEAYYSGDWRRAAELFSWYVNYAEAYAAGNHFRNEEVFREALPVVEKLAEICRLHGHPEEAVNLYNHLLDSVRQHLPRHQILRFSLGIRRDTARIATGEISDEAAAAADEALAFIRKYRYYSVPAIIEYELKRARIYHALGRKDEAWAMVDEQLTASRSSLNPYLWTCILTTAIDLAMDDGCSHPKLEEWLILALDNERLRGHKFGELALYEKYARFLAVRGRYAEAVQVQREALRMARGTDIQPLIRKMQKLLEHYAAHISRPVSPRKEVPENAGNPMQFVQARPEEDSGEPVAGTERVEQGEGGAVPAVDIQPRSSVTASLPGAPAFGRFYLFNPSSTAQAGTLFLSGAAEEPTWQSGNWLVLKASPVFPDAQWSAPITLAPGARHVIDISAVPAADGTQATIRCGWIPAGSARPSVTSLWEYSTGTTEKRTAVIDAHEIRQNPFYLIPVRHMIQRCATKESQVTDIRVRASDALRIEIYDETDVRLLAVDANGDGDFRDQGDLIANDTNRNNRPDITIPAGETNVSIVLYVRPQAAVSADEIELDVEVFEKGVWRTDAVDTIRLR